MNLFMHPQMAKYKAIETVDLSSMLTTFKMKESCLIDTAVLNTAESFFSSNKVEDIGLIEFRKRTNNYDVDAMMLVNKDKNSATFGENSWTIHCTNYLCAIMDRKVLGMRLRDLLLTNVKARVESYLKGTKTTTKSINTVCGTEWVKAFVSKLDEISSKIRVKGSLIRAEDITQMNACIDLLIKDGNFSNVSYYDEASVILLILSKAVADYRSFMQSKVTNSHSFVNRKRVEINQTLTPSCKDSIISYLVAEQQFSLIKTMCGDEITLSEIFQFNKRTGALELRDEALEKFIKLYSRDMLSVLISTANFELKLSKKWDTYKSYLENLLLGEPRYATASSFEYSNLWTLFFDSNYSYSDALDEVQIKRKIDVQSELVLPMLGKISAAVAVLYRPCDATIVGGFTVSHHITNGRDLIYRLDHTPSRPDEVSLLSGILMTDKKNKKDRTVYSFKHRIYQMDSLNSERVISSDNYPGELSSVGTEGLSSSFGVAVYTSKKLADFWNLQTYRALSFNFIYGTDDPVISIKVESNLVTVMPPADGVDVLSFGMNTRRSSGNSRFEVKQVSSNSDIIDILLACPAYVISSTDQETLAGVYRKLVDNLTQDDLIIRDVLYLGPSSLEQLRPIFGTFLSGIGDQNLPYRKVAFNCLPSKTSSNEFSEKQLPRFVALEKEISTCFTIPFEWLTSRVQEYISRFGEYHDCVGRNGKNILHLYFRDHDNYAANCVKNSKLPVGTDDKFQVAVVIEGDIRDVYKLDRFVKSLQDSDTYLYEIKYLDPEIAASSRRAICVLDGQGRPMDFHKVFKLYPSVEGSQLDKAFAYALDLAYSIWFYKFSGIAKEELDIDVLVSELNAFSDCLSQRYSSDLKLARICKTASGNLDDLVKKIKSYQETPSETLIKEVISKLSITSSFELYTASVLNPLPPTKRYEGVMQDIFDRNMQSLSCIDKPSKATIFAPDVFDDKAICILTGMVDSYVVKGSIKSSDGYIIFSTEELKVDEINKKLKDATIERVGDTKKYVLKGDVTSNSQTLVKLLSNCSYSKSLAALINKIAAKVVCRYIGADSLEKFLETYKAKVSCINDKTGLLLTDSDTLTSLLNDKLVEVVE